MSIEKRFVEGLEELAKILTTGNEFVTDTTAYVQKLEDMVGKLQRECDLQRDVIMQLQTQIGQTKMSQCFWCRH